jgi:lipopolysaccharide/colanic/teichoic acid biosynthesis glycosyltransferase
MSAKNSKDRTETFYARTGKRIFDLVLSIPSLIILSPVYLLSAILIKLDTPGPILFSQDRIGQNGKPFRLYKFRTMVKDAAKIGPPVTTADDPRITRTGRLLRKFKVDEMLQVMNIVKGDMSVIGPRPEVKKYIDIFAEEYKDILKIKPGMTDYALIAFRNEEDILSRFQNVEEGYIKEVMPKKIKLYRQYLSEMSLRTDIKIFFQTIWEILVK